MLRNKDSHDSSMLWKGLATLTCDEARVKKERKRKRETTDDLFGGDEEGFFSLSSSVGAGGKAAAVNASPPISPEDESMVPPDARVAFYNLIRYITSLQWVSEENHGNETVKAKSEDVLPDRIRRDLSAHPIICTLKSSTGTKRLSFVIIIANVPRCFGTRSCADHIQFTSSAKRPIFLELTFASGHSTCIQKRSRFDSQETPRIPYMTI